MITPSESNPKKTFTIETYGWEMNEYDTQLLRAVLSKANYVR